MSGNHNNESVETLKNSLKHFSIVDYSVFIAMLMVCTIVGLYFGYEDYKKRKHAKKHRRGSEAQDYLLGSRNMKIFPVAMSLVASCISGIALLGTSSEIYLYGYQYAFILIGYTIAAIIVHYTVIPLYHELQITSAYEYLQRRFDKKVRLFGSAMYVLSTLLWMPIAVYVPALAFSQVSGVADVHLITPLVMFICIFYTCLGGIKAVVWTDVIQILLMYGTLVVIVIKGTQNVGGVGVVIERNIQSERLAFPDLRLDPTIRISLWTMAIGGTFFRTYVGINQSMIQRYMTLKNVQQAQRCQLVYLIGIIALNLMCYYNGLLLYATYHDCDPLTTKLATAKDQIMPLFVMELLKDIPGLPGLFIAGVFSAALSSISTALNSLAAVILEDFCKTFYSNDISEKASAIIMRGTVLIFGTLSVALVYVVQHMGSVLQLSLTVPSICFGPLLGVYVIGLTIPKIGKRATLYGALGGCFSMIAFIMKVEVERALGNIYHPIKPTSVEGCQYEFVHNNVTHHVSENHGGEKSIFHLSFMYYTALGMSLVLFFSFLFSFVFGFKKDEEIDVKFLAPFMRKYYSHQQSEKDNVRKNEMYEFKEENNKLME